MAGRIFIKRETKQLTQLAKEVDMGEASLDLCPCPGLVYIVKIVVFGSVPVVESFLNEMK